MGALCHKYASMSEFTRIYTPQAASVVGDESTVGIYSVLRCEEGVDAFSLLLSWH